MKIAHIVSNTLSASLLLASSTRALDLTVQDDNSIKDIAKTAAAGLTSYYTGYKPGDVAGNLPDPYYWWEAGAMFGALIDYWHYTGDDQYNDMTYEALLHQVGENKAYMPSNQSKSLGNDDQGFWGMAVMSAAERKFKDPPSDQPQWLALAQAVFTTQATRWKPETCAGGLRWQIFIANNGYNYKNTISNGCFFNVAARLARYTGNQTYSEWAERTWDWIEAVGLVSDDFHFFDGTDSLKNCSDVNGIQWTYNAGIFMLGAAHMYNMTESDTWKTRLDGIISGISVFFKDNVMYEAACEPYGTCDIDQTSFKSYLARWMGSTMQVAPHTIGTLLPLLQSSATAAAKQCNPVCGNKWTDNGVNDGKAGVGEQMAVLEVVQNLLSPNSEPPVTDNSGGTSVGDYDAGTDVDDNPTVIFDTINTGDKAGAGILTALVLVGLLAGAWWMIAN